MKIIIWISTAFEGFHRWKDAPYDVAFLRNFHRHVFDVKLGMEVEVGDDNREIESIQLKKEVDRYIQRSFESIRFEYSCEQLAKILMMEFDACFVEVSEDGENGVIIYA